MVNFFPIKKQIGSPCVAVQRSGLLSPSILHKLARCLRFDQTNYSFGWMWIRATHSPNALHLLHATRDVRRATWVNEQLAPRVRHCDEHSARSHTYSTDLNTAAGDTSLLHAS